MTNNGNIGTTRYVYNYNVLYCTFEDTCTRTCRFRYLNIFQLAEKTASQGWTPALAPRRGTAPRSWRARGDTMEGREVVRALHWMLWNLSVDARIPTLLFTRVCLILPYFRNILLNCCFMDKYCSVLYLRRYESTSTWFYIIMCTVLLVSVQVPSNVLP